MTQIVKQIGLPEPTPISLANYNNKLWCNAFVVINLPPPEPLKPDDHTKIFSILVNGKNVLVRIVSVITVPFLKVGEWYTLPANGLTEGEWRRYWMGIHPNTTDETLIGIYYYKRL